LAANQIKGGSGHGLYRRGVEMMGAWPMGSDGAQRLPLDPSLAMTVVFVPQVILELID